MLYFIGNLKACFHDMYQTLKISHQAWHLKPLDHFLGAAFLMDQCWVPSIFYLPFFVKIHTQLVIWICQRSDRRAIWTSRTIWAVIVSLIASHCFTNYLVKTATVHVPTHVVHQYQPVIRVITVKTGLKCHDQLYINSRHPWLYSLRQRDRANCALYQFDRSVRDQQLMMRDLEKYGDQYH